VRVELLAGGRELEVDDVAELALRVVGDADGDHRGVGGLLHVLVIGGVEEILRNGRHARLRRGRGWVMRRG
jgi:hypothetical protein